MVDSRPALISIVGMVRSGSTYFEGRVAELCRGVAVGELVGAWGAMGSRELLCSCGSDPQQCRFWTSVAQRYPRLLDGDTIDFMTSTNSRIMPVRKAHRWRRILRDPAAYGLDRYCSEVSRLYEAVVEVAGDYGFATVIDSSKHPIFYGLAKADVEASLPRCLAVRIVRDPRAVAYSLMSPKQQRAVSGDSHRMKAYSWWTTIPFWVAMNIFSDVVVSKTVPRFRYEDFAEERYLPWLEREGVLGHQGIREPDCAWHQLVANPMRYRGPARFDLDERWRTSLPARVRALALLGYPLMRRYGYGLRRKGS